MRPQPVHLHYSTADQSEYCLRFGPVDADRIILIVPPLFDEMNHTRRMMVEMMRELATRDVASLLPDLPGCNESTAALSIQSIESWRRAVSDVAAQLAATHVVAIRGGGLLDDAAALLHRYLRVAHLRRRHHLHGLGDLADVFDGTDALLHCGQEQGRGGNGSEHQHDLFGISRHCCTPTKPCSTLQPSPPESWAIQLTCLS